MAEKEGEVSDLVTNSLRAREGAAVERCHTTPHHGSYSVGSHSFGMLLLLRDLYPVAPPCALTWAIVQHDLAERWTGDLPGCVGGPWPRLKNEMNKATEEVESVIDPSGTMTSVTSEELKWLKALDKLELFLWCEDQVALGNRHVEFMHKWLDNYFAAEAHAMPLEVSKFYRSFCWRRTQDVRPGE